MGKKFHIFSNSLLSRTYAFRKANRNVAVFTGIDYFYLEVVVGGVERIPGLRQSHVYYTLASTRVFKHLQYGKATYRELLLKGGFSTILGEFK